MAHSYFDFIIFIIIILFLFKTYILQLDWPADSYVSLRGPVDQLLQIIYYYFYFYDYCYNYGKQRKIECSLKS